jgi:hypothetical protein
MKIGILTFHNIPNIGAMLQAYALCRTIRSLDYSCDIIDYACDNIIKRELEFHSTNNVFKDFIIKRFIWPKTQRKINQSAAWMKSTGVIGLKSYRRETIKQCLSDYDVFVTGSDMVWNLDITEHDYTFFQDFVTPDKKQISYASSIGSKWAESDYAKIKDLLSRYSSISVREDDTNLKIKELGLNSRLVADPTMLLTPAEWGVVGESVEQKFKDYVLVYFPNKQLIDAAKRYARKHGLKVVVISSFGSPLTGVAYTEPMTPPEWISLFYHAAAVFSNSYHGLLFSLYFNKALWTANYGNRIVSILTYLNQPGIMLKNDADLSYKIDYMQCNRKLDSFRTESTNYLKEALV